MGFPRDQCVHALRLAFNNADRAVQFLLEGTAGMEEEEEEPEGGDEPMGGVDSAALFQRLTQDPQFQQLRGVLQTNPSLLESLLNQLKQSNPAVYGIIMDNREAFSRWLSEGSSSGTGAQSGGGDSDMPHAAPEQPVPPHARPVRIELSPDDRSAIQSLVEMGFNENDALQAYIACDRNLQLAANFLMENGGF